MSKKNIFIISAAALVAAILISVGLHNHALQNQAVTASPNPIFSQPVAPAGPKTFVNVSSLHQKLATKHSSASTHKDKDRTSKQAHHKAEVSVKSTVHAGIVGTQHAMLIHSPLHGTSANTSLAAPRATVRIKMVSHSFAPARISVKAGTTIIWNNASMVPHTVTIDSGPQTFDSGMIVGHGSFRHTFQKVGTYTYECTYHSGMMGTIIVHK